MILRKVPQISLLASLSVALRYSFSPFPNIKPLTAIFLLLVVYMGLGPAWLVMALTMLISALFTGIHPIIMGQLLAYTVVLFIWGKFICPLTQQLKGMKMATRIASATCLVFVYGLLISFVDSWLYAMPVWPYWLRGLSFDALHAFSTAAFYPIIDYILRRTLTNEKNLF